MRLIDADALLDKSVYRADHKVAYHCVMAADVENAPTVDAEPVRRGRWIYNPNANDWGIGGWCCNKCGYKNDVLGISEPLPLPIKMIAGTNYCPHCGAKMVEVEE